MEKAAKDRQKARTGDGWGRLASLARRRERIIGWLERRNKERGREENAPGREKKRQKRDKEIEEEREEERRRRRSLVCLDLARGLASAAGQTETETERERETTSQIDSKQASRLR